ncbi:hypothetical protein [Micromonospora sp. NPDC005367]|uniref:hypothetical protein n=1 Tax=Micromonospora sp. NPDC005367 TaxID=3155590 RepID=UPI0033B96138
MNLPRELEDPVRDLLRTRVLGPPGFEADFRYQTGTAAYDGGTSRGGRFHLVAKPALQALRQAVEFVFDHLQ